MGEPVEQLFPRSSRAAYRVCRRVIGAAMRRTYDITVEASAHVPSIGAAILAANHASFLDSIVIPLAAGRRVTYLAKAEYWDSWKTRWFFDLVGQIPVRREDATQAHTALAAAQRVLSAGGLLGIYPEGTRSVDGRLYRGRTGAARMAFAAGCPVIAVGVRGTDDIMPAGAKVPKARGSIFVKFGEPMLPDLHARSDPLVLRSFTDELMYRIMQITGREYVDCYAPRAKPEATPVQTVQA